MKITLLKTNKEAELIYEGEYREVPLEEMYKLIGCSTVERLPLPTDNTEIWIDEEGKLKYLWEINLLASDMFKDAFKWEDTDPNYDWRVAGNALVIERTGEELEMYNAE